MDFLNFDDPTGPANQKSSGNEMQNSDGFTLGVGDGNLLNEGENSGMIHQDTFPLIDESALNLDFGSNKNSQSTGSSSVQQTPQQQQQHSRHPRVWHHRFRAKARISWVGICRRTCRIQEIWAYHPRVAYRCLFQTMATSRPNRARSCIQASQTNQACETKPPERLSWQSLCR